MATVYKRTERKPIPAGATITESRKAIPNGATVENGVASWTDREGCQRTAAVAREQVVLQRAEWRDSKGGKSAPIDHTGRAILVVTGSYYAAYSVGARRVRKSTKVTDKAIAQRIANQWENDDHLVAEGHIDDDGGLAAKYRTMPFAEHVDAFIAFMGTKGGTEDHRERTRKHIEEFASIGKWKAVQAINPDDVTRHVQALRTKGKSSRTIQARLQSIKSFTKWLFEQQRIKRDPLVSIKKPDPEADRKHERRMLLQDEWEWLAKATAANSAYRNGMDAAERLLLYRTAIQTGLRSGELFGLTRGNLKLDADTPHITCKASGTKNRKPAKQFIDPELAGDLASHIRRKTPKAPVFGIAAKDELARTIEQDLYDARLAWLASLADQSRVAAAESDFLAKINDEGKHLVFHSLRHSTGAWLAMAGVSIKVIQEVMRHSTPVLTLNTYGHLFPGQCEGAPATIAAMMAGSCPAKVTHTSPIHGAKQSDQPAKTRKKS